MLGFGALGEFALGEGPNQIQGFAGGQWDARAVRKTGLAIAIIAGSFTGFVPQPPAQAAPVFTKFSQPQPVRVNLPDEQPSALFEILAPSQPTPVFARFSEPSRSKRQLLGFVGTPQPAFFQPYVFGTFSQPLVSKNPLADEQPSTLFEVEPPQPAPFTGFCPFEGIIRAKFNVALHAGRWWGPITLPVDTHDGVWVKKKRKKHDRDPIELELEEKARRRAAIELAVYGPEPEISAQISPERPDIHSIPDVSELARMVMAARQAEAERLLQEQAAAEEDDIEAILKDIL